MKFRKLFILSQLCAALITGTAMGSEVAEGPSHFTRLVQCKLSDVSLSNKLPLVLDLMIETKAGYKASISTASFSSKTFKGLLISRSAVDEEKVKGEKAELPWNYEMPAERADISFNADSEKPTITVDLPRTGGRVFIPDLNGPGTVTKSILTVKNGSGAAPTNYACTFFKLKQK